MEIKLNVVAMLGAVVMFLLPWVELRCSGDRVATQTGVQLVYGGATSRYAEAEETEARTAQGRGDRLSMCAWGVLLAGLAVGAGLVAAVMQLRGSDFFRRDAVAITCAIALGAILVQAKLGWPMERALVMEASEALTQHSNSGFGVNFSEGPILVDSAWLGSLWAELIALAVPLGFAANRWLERLKAK